MNFLKVALAALFLASIGPCLARPAQAADAHGAISVEAGTWAFGFQVDATDDATATNQANANCNRFTNGANDCRMAVVFSSHRCGAVVVDRSANRFSFGRGRTQAEASSDALNKLSSGSVLVAQCNSTGSSSSFAPEPIRARAEILHNDNSPVAIYGASVESRTDRTYQQCLSWRNVSNKEIAAIKFDVRFYDEFNAPQPSFTLTRDGKYSPGINIDNICWHGDLWTPQQIRQMKVEKIAVASVRFADDALWTPGVAWTKAYSTSGSALAAPQTIAAGSSGASGGTPVAPISVGGAIGGGGAIGASDPAFGAIAMQPGTRLVGIAIDARTDDAAVYEALSKCNQQTANANNCLVMLKFSGANKCAALAVDGIRYGTGMSRDLNDSIATALANLRANGGNMGNNVVASPCNSR